MLQCNPAYGFTAWENTQGQVKQDETGNANNSGHNSSIEQEQD